MGRPCSSGTALPSETCSPWAVQLGSATEAQPSPPPPPCCISLLHRENRASAQHKTSEARNTLHTWKKAYFDTRAKIEASGREARWEFDRKRLFERTDYMAAICQDLCDILQVGRLERVFSAGPKGGWGSDVAGRKAVWLFDGTLSVSSGNQETDRGWRGREGSPRETTQNVPEGTKAGQTARTSPCLLSPRSQLSFDLWPRLPRSFCRTLPLLSFR